MRRAKFMSIGDCGVFPRSRGAVEKLLTFLFGNFFAAEIMVELPCAVAFVGVIVRLNRRVNMNHFIAARH